MGNKALCQLPPMGWNSWNTFTDQISESLILETADALKEKGFLEREPMANSFRYKVIISESQYHGDTVSEVVARYYDNSYLRLVSQFVEEDKMNLQELKNLIAQIEKNKK